MAHAQQTQVSGWTGWISAASFLMIFVGFLHIIYGFAALFNYSWYISTSSAVYMLDLTQWGWALLIGGGLLILTGILLFTGNMFGRVVGGVLVTASLLVNMSVLLITPLWSILAIVVDILILYAIIAHGSEMKNLTEE